MRPPACSAISGPVVWKWVWGLTGLWNWLGMNEPGVVAAISAALETAPAISWSAGVRTTRAPAAVISFALTAP
jgi:hypothetical protein